MTDIKLHFVEVEGFPIAYREAGQGPALVFLHGFLCDSRCWRHQMTGLSDHFRVLAWDAPGAGRSFDPPEDFTTADYARYLAGFLDALGIGRADVVGLSWGGILAQEFYGRHPEYIRRLVLAGTYAGWKGSLPERACQERLETCLRDADGPRDSLIDGLLPGMFTDSVSQDVLEELSAIMLEFHPIGFRLMSLSSAETDTSKRLPGIMAPTLVLWGDDDRRSPLHIAEQICDAIPAGELAIIPKAGHVSNMEQPEEFNEHVRRFCLEGGAA